jgi:hypothetical protein
MTHRYTIAAAMLAAFAVPAAAQQTTTSPSPTTPATQSDTSKASAPTTSTPTNSTSNGAVTEPSTAPTTPSAPSPTPSVTTPSSAMPSSPAPSSPMSGSGIPSSVVPSTGLGQPNATQSSLTPSGANQPAGAVQPTSGAIKVNVKVAPSLANTAKISADSAFALARQSNTAGEISSAELEMTDKRLVYQVKMVKGAGASTVYVDAMTGEVVKDKKFGGLKASVENQEESQKLYEAKKDSIKATKP